ncbi:MAG TPA: hypothetical protein VIP77_20810 [Jiangellaceae bacterium]
MKLRPSSTTVRAALAGALAGGVALGVGELVSAAVGPASAPFLAVGNAFVDLTPEWLKSFAIRTFGQNDKIVLLLGMAGVIALGAALAGVLELRRPPAGSVVLAAAGLVAGAAALTRPAATLVDVVPTVAGIALGVVVLRVLVGHLRAATKTPAVPEAAGPTVESAGESVAEPTGDSAAQLTGETAGEARLRRRRFLVLSAAAAGLAVLATVGGRRLGQAAQDVRAARDRLRLPTPAGVAPALPSGVQLSTSTASPRSARRMPTSTASTPRCRCRRSFRRTGGYGSTAWSRARSSWTSPTSSTSSWSSG